MSDELRGFARYLHEAQEGMRESAALINQLTDERTRRVPESHFRKYLLNTVRQWVTRDGAPEIGYWLNVCDGLNREFYVYKDDEPDVILFTVPPPFTDVDIPTKLPEGFTMADRYNSLPHVVNRQGYVADQGDIGQFFELEEQIIHANAAKPGKEAMAKALSQLVTMYRYYNLPLEELLGKEGAAEISKHLDVNTITSNKKAEEGISDEPDAYEF